MTKFDADARARIVAAWRQQSHQLTQREFLSGIAATSGATISCRTLRNWIRGSPDVRAPAEAVRKVVDDAIGALEGLLAQLQQLRVGVADGVSETEPGLVAVRNGRAKSGNVTGAAPVRQTAPEAETAPGSPAARVARKKFQWTVD